MNWAPALVTVAVVVLACFQMVRIRNYYRQKVSTLEAERDRARDDVKSLKGEVQTAQEANKTLQEKRKQERVQVGLDQETAKKEKADLTKMVQKYTDDVSVLSQQKTRLQDEVKDLEAQNQALRDGVSKTASNYTKQLEDLKTLASSDVLALQKQLQDEKQEASRQIESLKIRAESLRVQAESAGPMKQRIDDLLHQVQELNEANTDLASAVSREKSNVGALYAWNQASLAELVFMREFFGDGGKAAYQVWSQADQSAYRIKARDQIQTRMEQLGKPQDSEVHSNGDQDDNGKSDQGQRLVHDAVEGDRGE